MPVLEDPRTRWDANDLRHVQVCPADVRRYSTAAKAVDVRLPKEPDPAGPSDSRGWGRFTWAVGAAKTSVLDQFDGGPGMSGRSLRRGRVLHFTSGTHKNPTLTIMALSWRASEYMLSEMKKGSW
jgi:hypothetical protein